MTLPRLDAMMNHWRQFPPVHVSVAQYLGAGKKPAKGAAANDADAGTASYINAMPVLNVKRPS